MWISALNRKLLREAWRLRGQIVTISIVLASGMICFISMRGTYASLAVSKHEYYDRYRFADVFARAERVPESVARRIEALPGVAVVETRVAEEVSLPIDGMERPAYGRLLSLPSTRPPATNALYLRRGRYPEAGKSDEIVLLDSFAEAHGLVPGHRVPVVVNGKRRSLRVVGIALSPEFVYAIRPGALVDDPKRHAVLWMERSALASAFQLDGAFNDVTLRLAPGASEQGVRVAVDRILARYGGIGSIGRKDQVSNRILSQELDQLGVLSTMIPAVFLGVTAFLVNLVLGRMIRLQRPEIATLKAIGYSNREVGGHYLPRHGGSGARLRGGARWRLLSGARRARAIRQNVPVSDVGVPADAGPDDHGGGGERDRRAGRCAGCRARCRSSAAGRSDAAARPCALST